MLAVHNMESYLLVIPRDKVLKYCTEQESSMTHNQKNIVENFIALGGKIYDGVKITTNRRAKSKRYVETPEGVFELVNERPGSFSSRFKGFPFGTRVRVMTMDEHADVQNIGRGTPPENESMGKEAIVINNDYDCSDSGCVEIVRVAYRDNDQDQYSGDTDYFDPSWIVPVTTN